MVFREAFLRSPCGDGVTVCPPETTGSLHQKDIVDAGQGSVAAEDLIVLCLPVAKFHHPGRDHDLQTVAEGSQGFDGRLGAHGVGIIGVVDDGGIGPGGTKLHPVFDRREPADRNPEVAKRNPLFAGHGYGPEDIDYIIGTDEAHVEYTGTAVRGRHRKARPVAVCRDFGSAVNFHAARCIACSIGSRGSRICSVCRVCSSTHCVQFIFRPHRVDDNVPVFVPGKLVKDVVVVAVYKELPALIRHGVSELELRLLDIVDGAEGLKVLGTHSRDNSPVRLDQVRELFDIAHIPGPHLRDEDPVGILHMFPDGPHETHGGIEGGRGRADTVFDRKHVF